MKRIFLTALFVILAACTNDVAQPMPQMTFAQLQPIPINVNAVNVSIGHSSSAGDFIANPAQVTQNYLKARFAPGGPAGALNVVVEDASVVKLEQPSSNTAMRWMNVGGMDVYNLILRIRFDYAGGPGSRSYGQVFNVRRQINVSEHASIAERERHQLLSLEKMFDELDPAVRKVVLQDMRLGM
jgi:hypothetical protein